VRECRECGSAGECERGVRECGSAESSEVRECGSAECGSAEVRKFVRFGEAESAEVRKSESAGGGGLGGNEILWSDGQMTKVRKLETTELKRSFFTSRKANSSKVPHPAVV